MNTSCCNKSELETTLRSIEASLKNSQKGKLSKTNKWQLNSSKSISYLPLKTKLSNSNAMCSLYAITQASLNITLSIALKQGYTLSLSI